MCVCPSDALGHGSEMAVYFSADTLFMCIQKAKPPGMYKVTFVVFFLGSKSVTALLMVPSKKPVEYLRCCKDPQRSFPESDLKEFVYM